jgi:hypothetical protein
VLDPCLSKLEDAGVFTVGDLRELSPARIEKLELPPVVTEYLLRVMRVKG